MAIVINDNERKVNWIAISIVSFILIVLILGTYYLFFSPTPLIEAIVPPDIQKVSQISEIDISVGMVRQVTDNPVTKMLKAHIAPPAPGSFGRENPFSVY